MTTSPHRFLRQLLLASLGSLGVSAALGATEPVPDSAAQLLARDGLIPVVAAGPFVEPGTFRVQVSTKLGRPDLTLADGTWLFHHRRVGDSAAEGTLVVRFRDGRVSSLALVTPAVVAALRAESGKSGAADRLAAK